MRDWDKEQRQAHIDNHQVYGGTYECPTIPDVLAELLEEPVRQKMYSAKHCLSTDPVDTEKAHEAFLEIFYQAWEKAFPTAKIPTLHNPMTNEDHWNLYRLVAINCYGRDIGPYPGDETVLEGYRYYKYQDVIDPNIVNKDDRDMLLYDLYQASKTPDGFGGEPECFMQSNGETR